MPGAVYSVSRDENPQRVNEMDSPSFEGFHTQLDCKLMYYSKSQTRLTLMQCIKFRVQKKKQKTEQNRNDENYSQTGIIGETHTNHDGVMLRSNAASSSWRSPVITVKKASVITSAALRENY